MKRFGFLVVLMALSTSAHARSYSFSIGGHRIHFETSRHCYWRSCVSVSGLYPTHRKDRYRDRNDGIVTADQPPAKPASIVEPVAARPVETPANKPEIVASAPPPPVVAPPQTAAPLPAVVPPAPPPPKPAVTATTPVTPPSTPPVEIPTARVPPPADVAPQILKVAHDKDEEPAETPLGDWHTEGNTGAVRIQQCGTALCGYVLNASSNAIGESVLINMKPKSTELWSGNIFSRASGSTYYGTMAMKGANSLRVEACALGSFFCSGNVWTRIAKPQEQITARQDSPQPKS